MSCDHDFGKGIKARANCKVYWGTYLQIEQFFAQACNPPKWKPGMKPPKPWHERPAFRKWDGRGIVAVQLQGHGTEYNPFNSGYRCSTPTLVGKHKLNVLNYCAFRS